MRIIVDGYNLIRCSPSLRKREREGLEEGREALLEELARYRRLKGHEITVVFDGMGNPHLGTRAYTERGIRVIFTGSSRADDWIKKEVRKGKRVVVVTSDREIREHVERAGSVAIGSGEFEEIMMRTFLREVKGEEEEGRPEKRGPARRLPKRERERERVLAKL